MNFENVAIQTIWDEVAEFAAAHADEAIKHLVRRVCELIDADNASHMAVVRMDDLRSKDASRGWRPCLIHFLNPTPERKANVDEQLRKLDAGKVDASGSRNVTLAGAWRTNLLVDLVGPEWFESDYYKTHYLRVGYADGVWAG
jgi:hypothetical protein